MQFAELTPGLVLSAGPRRVTAQEITRFASQYDPQWFHVDPTRAAQGRWRGLIASGWHTCAIAMELVVLNILHGSTSYGSPGIEQLRWLEPVRPEDQLTLRVQVLDSRVSASGGTGILRWRWGLWNQDDRQVLDQIGTSLFDLKARG